MKLSKQERIAIFVVAVIVIIGAGIFLFIMPRIEAISASNSSLDAKVAELAAAQEKAATKEDLKVQVMEAYKKGENLADMFFPEMTTYELDHEFRDFIHQVQERCRIVVEDYSISEPTVETLSPTYFTESEVVYALKTYVTQNIEPTEEEIAAENRRTILREALGSSQTVGAISINFTVKTFDADTLLDFCDEVNNYVKEEAGGPTRKALKVGGMTFTYDEVSEKYEKLVEELDAKAHEAGDKELQKNHPGYNPEADQAAQPEGEGEQTGDVDKEKISVGDETLSVGVNLTFYFVERMQDPTEQLKAQDAL